VKPLPEAVQAAFPCAPDRFPPRPWWDLAPCLPDLGQPKPQPYYIRERDRMTTTGTRGDADAANPLHARSLAVTDKNGNEVKKSARCRFDAERGWTNGIVRDVRATGVWADHARVDDGDVDNDDLHTNGFHVSAWVCSEEIEVLP